MKRILLVLLSLALLSGCGFHPRRAADIPPQLRTLHLDTSQPYSQFITQLKGMLQALNIKLVKQAPYTLKIISISFTQDDPSITTTALAVTITYTLSVRLRLLSSSGKAIIPDRTLSTSRSISQNTNQVYTPGTATLAKQELRRDLISQLYYLLTANDTRNALSHAH